jgi:hypothetical protein
MTAIACSLHQCPLVPSWTRPCQQALSVYSRVAHGVLCALFHVQCLLSHGGGGLQPVWHSQR